MVALDIQQTTRPPLREDDCAIMRTGDRLAAMRRNAVVVTKVVVGVVCATMPAIAQSPSFVFAKVRRSVVTVVACDKKGEPLRMGTGFVWRDDGLIATAYHVIANAASRYVRFADGRRVKVAEVAVLNQRRDFAILKVGEDGLRKLQHGNTFGLRQGDRVLTLSSALGMEETASEGLVSAVRESRPGVKLIQFTAPISPGSSGGPLLDVTGRVIGIILSTAKAGQNLNFALHIDAVATEEVPLDTDKKLRDAFAIDEILMGKSPAEEACSHGEEKLRRFEFDPKHDQTLLHAALADLDRAVRLNGNGWWAHFERGECLWSLGRIEDATAAYHAAHRVADEAENRWIALVRLEVAHARQGDLVAAIRMCDRQVETVDEAYSSGEWARGASGDIRPSAYISYVNAVLYARRAGDSEKVVHYTALLDLLYPGRARTPEVTDRKAVAAAIDQRTHTDYLRAADDYLRETARLKP